MSTLAVEHSKILAQLLSGPCVALAPDAELVAHLKHLESEGFLTIKDQPCDDCGESHGDLRLDLTAAGRETFYKHRKASLPVITINGTLLQQDQVEIVQAALHALPVSAVQLDPLAGIRLFPKVRAILQLFERKA